MQAGGEQVEKLPAPRHLTKPPYTSPSRSARLTASATLCTWSFR